MTFSSESLDTSDILNSSSHLSVPIWYTTSNVVVGETLKHDQLYCYNSNGRVSCLFLLLKNSLESSVGTGDIKFYTVYKVALFV